MKFAAVLAMSALTLGLVFLPGPEQPAPGTAPGIAPPPLSICPLVESGERHTRVSVLSTYNGTGRLSAFAAGRAIGSTEFSTGGSGAVTLDAADVSAVGVTGGLVELPSDATVSGVTVSGPDSIATEGCADAPSAVTYIGGGTTAQGASFQIQLLNPYAGEAVVDLEVVTDTGIETDTRFQSVVVPALSTIGLDMGEIISGRQFITAGLETIRGSVLAVGIQSKDGESSLWRAVEPGLDWWLPVPGSVESKLLIGNATVSDVDYQVDFYGPEGLVEGFESGTLDGRGETAINLSATEDGPTAVRVITSGDVVASLSVDDETGLAMTTGSPVDATSWLLPGASLPPGGAASLLVLNAGLDQVTMSVRTLTRPALVREVELAPDSVIAIDLTAADGYRVDASGPVVALWTSQVGMARSLAIGIPLQDG